MDAKKAAQWGDSTVVQSVWNSVDHSAWCSVVLWDANWAVSMAAWRAVSSADRLVGSWVAPSGVSWAALTVLHSVDWWVWNSAVQSVDSWDGYSAAASVCLTAALKGVNWAAPRVSLKDVSLADYSDAQMAAQWGDSTVAEWACRSVVHLAQHWAVWMVANWAGMTVVSWDVSSVDMWALSWAVVKAYLKAALTGGCSVVASVDSRAVVMGVSLVELRALQKDENSVGQWVSYLAAQLVDLTAVVWVWHSAGHSAWCLAVLSGVHWAAMSVVWKDES